MPVRPLATCFVILAVLVVTGCSGGKSDDPASSRQQQYAEPTLSPIATREVAQKLRKHFAEGALSSDASGGISSTNVEGSSTWSSNAYEEMWLMNFVEDTAQSENAVIRYMADLPQQCGDLGGEMSIGDIQRTDAGFRIASTYTLPPADTCAGRTGNVAIDLKLDERGAKMLVVGITEQAEGKELPSE